MSFCNNTRGGPGQIIGNPLNGLCERACIQVKKVFDACIAQNTLENQIVSIAEFVPPNPTLPLTFLSARSISSVGIISSLSVDPLSDRAGFARIQAIVGIPIEVLYQDANGVEGKGTAIFNVIKDIVMCVPSNSVIPVDIAATVALIAPDGVYLDENRFSITACVTIVMKVEAEVELLVPTYGYARIPNCQDFTQEVCTGVFDLPLFPTTPNT